MGVREILHSAASSDGIGISCGIKHHTMPQSGRLTLALSALGLHTSLYDYTCISSSLICARAKLRGVVKDTSSGGKSKAGPQVEVVDGQAYSRHNNNLG